MELWSIIYYFDYFLFTFVCLTVVYIGIFAMASMFSQHEDTPKSRVENRFIILIPAYKNGAIAEQTVRSILGQTYPQRLFDVTVIADQLDEMSNFRLAQQPITLLTPNFSKRSRAKSLQLAINNLPQFKLYDIAVVLNPGNIVEPEFLEQLNDAYEAAGTKAIQCHMLSQNRDTVSARLSAIFEEINNSIFRRGHVTLGLSAAASNSAMAFDFNWFKTNIMTTTTTWDDKELEARLLRQHIFVDYFDDIYVYGEKKRSITTLNEQRGRWANQQFANLFRNIRFLPGAIFRKQYNLADKLIQWMLVPRTTMVGIIMIMSLILPFIYLTMAIKWWIIGSLALFIFALATPDYLVDEMWDKTFLRSPFVSLWKMFNIKIHKKS
jgi:glycosyltransferase involved in cell wall biosynthesis